MCGANPLHFHQTKLRILNISLHQYFGPVGEWEMLSGKPRLIKTQGSIATRPLSNIRLSPSAVWMLALTTRQGEDRAKPDSRAHPSQTPELIEETWSTGPQCTLPWLIPSIPQFHYPPWPDVHFIKHTPSCIPTNPGRTRGCPHRHKKCNPNNLVHRELCAVLDRSHSRTSHLLCFKTDLTSVLQGL